MFDSGETIRKLALSTAWFSGLAHLSNVFLSGAGAILMLHRVTDEPSTALGLNSHLAVTPSFLDAALTEMKRLGYAFISMDELVEQLENRRSTSRMAAVTLDDGYRDNLLEGLPVLESHGAPFTVYVSPALIDGEKHLWWEIIEDIVTRCTIVDLPTAGGGIELTCRTPAEKTAAFRTLADYLTNQIPEQEQVGLLRCLASAARLDLKRGRKQLMSWSELKKLARHPLAEIGAHTINHYNLRRLEKNMARHEIAAAVPEIEKRLGIRPRHMAFPYGYAAAVGPREVALAREAGFSTAVTTRHGVIHAAHAAHLHALPRISVNGRYQKINHLRTMLSGITTPLANRGRTIVTV